MIDHVGGKMSLQAARGIQESSRRQIALLLDLAKDSDVTIGSNVELLDVVLSGVSVRRLRSQSDLAMVHAIRGHINLEANRQADPLFDSREKKEICTGRFLPLNLKARLSAQFASSRAGLD